ncbi:DUF4082 domain-containing protein [Glutamicibacter nicotianae]|uniref:DUF4082 domain-containing protein n=1 Tax=Glutamicibacter nicotianae TaxID=37929 RepID=UPI003C2CB1D4
MACFAGMLVSLLVAVPAQAAESCGPEDNAIVCENSKPGSPWTEWEVQGAGDDSIQGFATDISVNVGSPIDFKIDTDASNYSIDIYRTGWYQGLGARKIDSIEPSAQLPQHQPECLTDKSTELTDCGTWAVSATWNVPADAVSGVYLAKLTRTDTGGASHITFIVRNESSSSDILFQTSDPTWHAYNLYGGSDFYSGAANGRAFKISYNRPFATRDGIEARDFYFGAEYPLVRFLERNGYDVSYFSGVDTDRHGDLLTNHNVFLSVGHDEYWSGEQRANVEAARDAGVNLQFLSGNEVYWRTRYEPSSTGGNDYRTLVSYKETWSNSKIDPSSEWTGTWRDPRFAPTSQGGGLPENALTGTAYVVNSGDLPVTVSAQEGAMRLWRDTGLESQSPESTTELAPHTVGYESNEDLPNGFRPPGLIHLSTTTGDIPEYLQDFGNQVAPGTTTHHTTLYKAPSGATVFSAGSIQWTWGLDQWHDGNGAPEDPRMQQAQVNLLADMDALPATLMDTLEYPDAPKDLAAPAIQIHTAPASAVRFGEPITVEGTASDAQGQVAAVEYSFDGGQTWRLAEGTTQWSIQDVQLGMDEQELLVRAVDDSGNYPADPLPVPYEVTGPYSAFGQVEPQTPDSGDGSGVELGLRFTAATDGLVTGVRFYKSKANTGTHTGTLWSLNGTELATTAFTSESSEGWQTAQFSDPVQASAGDEFVVSYYAPNGHYAMKVQDFAYRGADASPVKVAGGFGTPSAGLYNSAPGFPTQAWDRSNYYVDALFETSASMQLAAYGQSPLPTAKSVPVDAAIGATLSKPVEAGSVAITLKDSSGAAVAGSTSYDEATRRATFAPDTALAEGTTYEAVLSATDLTGKPVASGGTWTFTTMQPVPADPADCPCSLYNDQIVPAQPAVNDGTPVTLGTRFLADTDGVVNGLKFYRSPGETGAHTGWLYTAEGTAIAQLQFPDDSASGWQYAAFDAPVPITSGTEYVASYRSNGIYPVTPGALGMPTQSGPLGTTSSAGHYSYADQFPSTRVSASYLVDVSFTPQGAGVTLAGQVPAPGVNDVPVDTQVTATFSEALEPGAKLELSTASGPVAGTSALDDAGTKLVFTPEAALPEATVITVMPTGISGVQSGPAEIPAWTFRTAGQGPALSTFLGDAVPQQLDPADSAPVELGLKFTAQQDLQIHALRYYQGPLGQGTHTGTIWDAQGTKLATVQFATGTAQGWRTAYLAEPVSMAQGSEFTISYHAPAGGYVYTAGEFANGKSTTALSLSGANGLYAYGAGSIPASSWNSTNYFVDLAYTTGQSPSPSPSTSPSPSSSTSPSPSASQQPLEATAFSPADESSSVPADAEISVTFNQPIDPAGSLSATAGGSPLPGSSELSGDGKILVFTPQDPLTSDAIITVTAQDISSPGGPQVEIPAWSFRTAAEPPEDLAACPCGLFPATDTPAVPAIDDGVPVTLGTRFSANTAGEILGLEFYRSVGETGAHTGWLYSTSGEVIAELTFPEIPVSGWQYAAFDTPVPIQPGNEYVAAYRSNGIYPASPGALGTPLQSGPLATTSSAGHYGYAEGYPGSTVSTSYLVDVRFAPAAEPLELVDRSPAAGASNVTMDSTISMAFNQPVSEQASIAVTAGGQPVAGSTVATSGNKTLVFTPDADLPEASVITVEAKDLLGEGGGQQAIAPWTFTTMGLESTAESFLGMDAAPEVLDPGDSASVELGLRMVAEMDVRIQALRYYQGPLGSGARDGTIWDASGQPLATASFDATSEQGWHTAYLGSPLEIAAGTEFTVSYQAPSGGYVHTPQAFSGGFSDGVLRLEGSNGVFAYGSGTMPDSSWNSTNYFVDVLYDLPSDSTASPSPESASPSPSAEPSPTQEPSPTAEPSATDQPSPAEEPSASPEPSTSPTQSSTSPEETPSPSASPSESTSDSPSGSPSESPTADQPENRPPSLQDLLDGLVDPLDPTP